MRGDQPVVSAASWMVSASMVTRSTLPRLCQGLLGRAEDRLALLGLLLVEADHRAGRGVGLAEAADDVAGLHRAVALPRLVRASEAVASSPASLARRSSAS